MSGEGLISVRLPKSLYGRFKATANSQGLDLHDAARRLISRLPSFTADEFSTLEDPPREPDMPRVSLYVGCDSVDALVEAAHESNLAISTILRRLLYAFLVSGQLQLVQNGEHWKLQITSQKQPGNSDSNGDKR
jgi:hypothetical protein